MTGARQEALRGWWLTGAAGVAVASGVGATLELMWGRFAPGGALLLLSVVALRWPQSLWQAERETELSKRYRCLGLLAVCALAVFFRTYHIEPPGLWGDEAVNGLRAFDILDGKITSPFELVPQPLTYFHALSNYPIAAAFWAFGPGPVTLRLPGIIAGILAVPLLYGTVAPLFGARVALIAAAFFASSAWQISHAKGVTQIVFGELFLLAGLCALVHGVVERRRWLIATAGLPLALCLYTYHSAKLAPFVAVIFVLAVLWHGTAPRRQLVRAGLLLAAVFVVCAVPAVLSYWRHPGALTQRISGVALWPALRSGGSLQPLWNAAWRTLMVFQYQQGPVYNWFGIGTDPALDLIVAFLFVHGLVQSLWRWKEPRHLLLLGWFVVGIVPGFLSTEAPRGYRIFLASPPCYVWAALPVAQLLAGAANLTAARRWLQGIVALLLLAVPLIDFNYYFYRVYTNRDFRWFQAERMLTMARTLKSRGPGWTGYLLSGTFNSGYESLAFLTRAWGLTMHDVSSLADVLPVHDDPQGGALFMIDRTSISSSSLMESLYPSIALDARLEPAPRTWWFDRWLPLVPAPTQSLPTTAFFPVSRRAADAIRGVTVSFSAADGTPLGGRVDAQLSLAGTDDLPDGPRPAQVRWSGTVYASADGKYNFALESGAAARVWIDGQLVVSHDALQAASALAEGLHRIDAEATVSDPPVLRLRWQPPGGAMQEIAANLLFRDADVHGLRADYESNDHTLHRIEPFPYYTFFAETLPDPFSVHWYGHLRVPAPGDYRLELVAVGLQSVQIDGRTVQQAARIPAGVHTLDMRMAGVRGGAHLQMFWAPPNGRRELIPPEAFSPPLGPAAP